MAVRLSMTCCICSRKVPVREDMYALDGEWRRRFPQMSGWLACWKCSVGGWRGDCADTPGGLPQDHIAALRPDGSVIDRCDAECHRLGWGSQKGMARLYPESAVLQGGREYLESLLDGMRADDPKGARFASALGA